MTAPTAVATLLVDVRPLDHPTARDRGIGRYTAGLIGGLQQHGAPVVGLYAGDRDAELARRAAPGLDLAPWSPAAIRTHAGPQTWYLATQLMLHPVSLDPIPSVITAAGLPVAAVMYDVIPYRNPARYLLDPNARALAEVRASLARSVDAMLAISEFSAGTAAEALRYPSDRVRTIGAGVDDHFVPADVRAAPWPYRIMPADHLRFVVAVTGADERKNTEGLLRAWALIDPAIARTTQLVIATAAPAPVLSRWRAVAAEVGVLDDVVFTGRVTDEEMVALLQRARLAILPSFEEGFGLPVLEAAACRCPVICSDTSSLPEVLDEPTAWFDPGDPASIATALERGVDDEAYRAVLAAAARRSVERFTWDRVAADAMAALADLGPRWPRRVQPLRRRIALAGRLRDPGSSALASALRGSPDRPHVDELVDASGTSEPTGVGRGRHPIGALGRYVKYWDFDDVVAILGDDPPLDRAATALASSVPLHLWLLGAAPPEAALDRARSVIVADDDAARAVRTRCPDGPPIAIIPPPLDLAWAVDDVALALLTWLGDVDRTAADTIRRFPATSS